MNGSVQSMTRLISVSVTMASALPTRSHQVAAAVLSLALVAFPSQAGAQPPSPIQVTSLLEADGARGGSTYRVALNARLNAGFHVNSNEPLDEGLIATSIALDPPKGIVVSALAWPESFMFTVGQDKLAVFGETFVIGVALDLADDIPSGEHVVSGTLRYQACDDSMCYFPTTAALSFLVNVVDQGHPIATANTEVFEGLSFATIADPDTTDIDRPTATTAIDDAMVMTRLANFNVLGTTGGYLGTDDFLDFIDRAESGRPEEGRFVGQGPLAIFVLILIGGLALNLTPCVLPMIPINLAIIGAGTKAGSRAEGVRVRFRLRSGHGACLRRAWTCRDSHGRNIRHDQRVAVVQSRHCLAFCRTRAGDVRCPVNRLLEPPEQAQHRRSRETWIVSLSVWNGWCCGVTRWSVRRPSRHSGHRALK